MKTARLDHIETYILEHRSVSLEEICETFQISKSTARRDLDELVQRGKTEKVYGGIRALVPAADTFSPMPLLPFAERDIVNHAEKSYICQLAAKLIQPGDVIFIDTGTTCMQIIENIKDIPCTVITNSLNVSLKAIPYENITVITTPGRLNHKTLSFTGHDVDFYLHSVNIQKAFMATTGLSIRGGLTNASEDEYNVKKSVCKNSEQIYVLADHDKFAKTALYTYSPLDKLTGIVTDRKPEEEVLAFCQDTGIQLLY